MNIVNKYIEKFTDKLEKKIDKSLDSIYHIDTPNKIESFRNSLINSGGPAFANKFIFALEIPNLIKEKSTLLDMLGVTRFDEELAILGTKVEARERRLNSSRTPYYNNLHRVTPGNYADGTITVTYLERSDRYVAKLFHEWMNNIVDPVTNCGHFYDDIAVDGRILYYDRADNNITKAFINFQGLVPLSVTMPTTDWASNEIVSVSVEFGYSIMNNESYNLHSLLDTINNFRLSDLVETIL